MNVQIMTTRDPSNRSQTFPEEKDRDPNTFLWNHSAICLKHHESETENEMSRDMTKPNKRSVRPAKTQISLGIRSV